MTWKFKLEEWLANHKSRLVSSPGSRRQSGRFKKKDKSNENCKENQPA